MTKFCLLHYLSTVKKNAGTLEDESEEDEEQEGEDEEQEGEDEEQEDEKDDDKRKMNSGCCENNPILRTIHRC